MAREQFGIMLVWAGIALSALGLIGWTEDDRDPVAGRMGRVGAVLIGAGLALTIA